MQSLGGESTRTGKIWKDFTDESASVPGLDRNQLAETEEKGFLEEGKKERLGKDGETG